MTDSICTLDGCDQPVADAPVCTRCATRTATTLREAADLWPALRDQVARQTRSGDPTPRAGRPAPSQPVRPDGQRKHYADQDIGWAPGLVVDLAASEDADAVRNTATTWVRVMWDARWPHGRPERDPGPWCSHDCGHGSCERLWQQAQAQTDHDRDIPPDRMAGLLRWLAERCEWIRHQAWGDEAIDGLGYAAGRVRPAVDRAPERVSLGPCDCGHQLTARADACTTACPACGVVWDVSVREQWLAQQARDYRGTPAEVAGWLSRCGIHTTPAMVRGLAHRRRISAVGGLYKLADVEECRLEELAKRSGRMAA